MNVALKALCTVLGGAKSRGLTECLRGGGFLPEGMRTLFVEEIKEFSHDGRGGFYADKRFAPRALLIAKPDTNNVIGCPSHAPCIGVVVGRACFPCDIHCRMREWATKHMLNERGGGG